MKDVTMRILAIGAHPDDLELGCGATLSKDIADGHAVQAIVCTQGMQGCGGDGDRRAETSRALGHLGVADVVFFDFPDTELHAHVLQLQKELERIVAAYEPHRVYTMFSEDRHQDHRAVFQASNVACRRVPQILMYETPSAYPNFLPTVFSRVSHEHMQAKRHALAMHESQRHRLYMDQDAINAAGKFRAVQVGVEGECESFMVHKYFL